MYIKKINKNIKYISQDKPAEIGEYFEKQTSHFLGVNEGDIYRWFDPANNYPEHVINEIRKGTTLESILFEDLIYKTGDGFNSSDSNFLSYLEKDIVNLHGEKFKSVFKETNDHINKLGNAFVELIFDEGFNLISTGLFQPQKCRLAKKKDEVWISKDWAHFDKNKVVRLPLYPKMKKFVTKGMVNYKSVKHIKIKTLGFDHYGINDKMIEALLLNEKEHRRNNWQLSQIKKGFKRDFFMVSEFGLNEREKKKADEAFKKMSGDDYAGGVENIEGENAKLVPANSTYDFDYQKDDTRDQLFLKMGFPKSLVGIKSDTAFSVEQVESDYDQYLPKVEEQQSFVLSKYSEIFNNHTNYNTSDWTVINNPPSVILQNYMPYMNDQQKDAVIKRIFNRYGIE